MHKMISIILSALGLMLMACTSADLDSDKGNSQQTGGSHTVEVEDKSGYTVKGYVSCDGQAVSGAVVSDGIHVTRTNRQGKYWMKTDSRSDFVFISVPSGTEVVSNGWEAEFWHRYQSSDKVQRFDFNLSSVDNNKHITLAFADVHISARTPMWMDYTKMPVDSLQFREHFMKDINDYASRQSVPVYGLNLGDMMQDMHYDNANLVHYRKVIRDLSFPTFHVVGNHDHQPELPIAPTDDPDTREFKRHYTDNLGPRYYSYNIGKVHYVVLDVNKMLGGGTNKYELTVTDRQLSWLRDDLSVVDKSYAIVIAGHVGTHRYKSGGSVITNRNAVLDLCKDFSHVYVLSGHAHIMEVYRSDAKTTNIVHPSAAGLMWWTRRCADGTKAAYVVYEFDGASCRITLKPYESDNTDADQIYVYGNSKVTVDGREFSAVVINVPAYELTASTLSSSWKLSVTENGVNKGEPTRYYGEDPEIVALSAQLWPADSKDNKPKKTNHIFYYVPDNPAAAIKVTAEDTWGRKYEKTIN